MILLRKRIKINNKIILIILLVAFLIGYYIYENNNYQEIESSSSNDESFIDEETQGTEQKTNQQTKENANDSQENKIAEPIIVHITGAVKTWGVIELEAGARIIDAVNKAGGFTEDADSAKVNLAYVLSDGVKIYIPNKSEESSAVTIKEYITEESGDNVIVEEEQMKDSIDSLVNINKATQTELESLPGIGPSTAMKIISYRQEQGFFNNIEDIKNVSGIGDSKFESIKDLICV